MAQVDVYNRALTLAGGKGNLTTTTDTHREAELCNLWYPLIRESVIKSATWPETLTHVVLTLDDTRASFDTAWAATDPAPTWKYSYDVPADMLAPRWLTNHSRFERAVKDSAVKIMTDVENAALTYVMDETDPDNWSSELELCIVHLLAAYLVMPLSGKETRAKFLYDKATEILLLQQTELANQDDDLLPVQLPEWIEARGYNEMPRSSKYFYPYDKLIGIPV